MAKIVIVRRHHPNEALSYGMALKVYWLLKRRGYDVEIEEFPYKITGMGVAREVARKGTGYLKEKDAHSALWGWMKETEAKHKDAVFFDFHNSWLRRKKKPHLSEYEPKTWENWPNLEKKWITVEMPAVFESKNCES